MASRPCARAAAWPTPRSSSGCSPLPPNGESPNDDEAPDPKPGDEAAAAKPKCSDKSAALPFSEDTERLDGRAWNRKPLIVLGVVLAVIAVIVLIVLAFNDVAGDDGDYNLIRGGAACLETAETPRDCIDTNHDGQAGPPATAD